jgi:hypothetical protein
MMLLFSIIISILIILYFIYNNTSAQIVIPYYITSLLIVMLIYNLVTKKLGRESAVRINNFLSYSFCLSLFIVVILGFVKINSYIAGFAILASAFILIIYINGVIRNGYR